MTRKVVALYNKREQAEQARQSLIGAGFNADKISLTAQPAAGTASAKDKSFWDSVREFFGWEDASDYEEATRRGGTLVMADVPEEKVDQAIAVLKKHNPIDINQQVKEWMRGGWERSNRTAASTPAKTATGPKGETVIPVAEEKLAVGKQREERGGVRIYSRVVEQPVHATVQLREEHINVERRPVDRPAGPEAFKERTIEATEAREVPVVTKEARVVEEVALNKNVTEHAQTVQDKVRKTEVEVEPLDEDFRKDFDRTYAGKGYTYDQFWPAYQYGQQLGVNPRYRNREWVAIEPEARTGFEKTHPGKWDHYREAIHHAYDAARTRLTSRK